MGWIGESTAHWSGKGEGWVLCSSLVASQMLLAEADFCWRSETYPEIDLCQGKRERHRTDSARAPQIGVTQLGVS